MFSSHFPLIPPTNASATQSEHPTRAPVQASLPSTTVPVSLAPSVTVGNLTFQTGRLMTTLSPTEKLALECAFHHQTPKESLEGLRDNHLLTYTIGAKDYFSPIQLPKELPQQMIITCALDQSFNLAQVIIADLNEHIYCNAHFEPSMPEPAFGERRSSSVLPVASTPRFASPTASPALRPALSEEVSRNAREAFWATAMAGSLSVAQPTPRAPSVSDDQIRQYLRNPDNSLRTARAAGSAIRSAGFSVSNERVSLQLRGEGGKRYLPVASDAQIMAAWRQPDGTIGTISQTRTILNASGVGGGGSRLSKLRQEMAITDIQRQ
jgi:hypothetical protein